MKSFFKRYRFFFLTLLALMMMTIWDRPHQLKALDTLSYSLKEMLTVIPPIFILLGFLDEWAPTQTMTRFMGEGSGSKGTLLAILVGSAAAGPLYGAFPIAGVFLKKGVSLFNVFVFIGAWSTTKIPMFLFEQAALGPKFAWTRLAVDIPGIMIIAWLLNSFLSNQEKQEIYKKAHEL